MSGACLVAVAPLGGRDLAAEAWLGFEWRGLAWLGAAEKFLVFAKVPAPKALQSVVFRSLAEKLDR